MGMNSLPKTVTRQRRGCDLNPGPSAPESSTLTTRLPSHPYTAEYDMSYESVQLNKVRICLHSACAKWVQLRAVVMHSTY